MDARSLLRAKKAEARIQHPYASYSARGDLRCSVCAVPVKHWDAHLLTKQHRTSAAREKAEQASKVAKQAATNKRDLQSEDNQVDIGGSSNKKIKKSNTAAVLPEGFFSKGNAPVHDEDDKEEEEEEDNQGEDIVDNGGESSSKRPTTIHDKDGNTGNNELDDFLASLSAPMVPDEEVKTEYTVIKASGQRKNIPKYKEIEPGQASYEAAPVKNIPAGEEKEEEIAEPEETEAERRARIIREEREEIVRRLEEEERAQEDADSRVSSLKERMALLKKRREAKGTAKSKGKQADGNGAANA